MEAISHQISYTIFKFCKVQFSLSDPRICGWDHFCNTWSLLLTSSFNLLVGHVALIHSYFLMTTGIISDSLSQCVMKFNVMMYTQIFLHKSFSLLNNHNIKFDKRNPFLIAQTSISETVMDVNRLCDTLDGCKVNFEIIDIIFVKKTLYHFFFQVGVSGSLHTSLKNGFIFRCNSLVMVFYRSANSCPILVCPNKILLG